MGTWDIWVTAKFKMAGVREALLTPWAEPAYRQRSATAAESGKAQQ